MCHVEDAANFFHRSHLFMASLMLQALPPRFTLGPPVTDSRGQEATNPPRATLGSSGSLSLIVELFPWGSGETLRLVNPPPAIGRLRLQAARVRSGLTHRMFKSVSSGCNATQIRLFTGSVDVRCGSVISRFTPNLVECLCFNRQQGTQCLLCGVNRKTDNMCLLSCIDSKE
jgi:hypothetical protein